MIDEELAKAGQEAAKFGTASVEATIKLGGFIAKYIDEPLSILSCKWADNEKFDRWENMLKIQDKVDAKLKARGCKTIKKIPLKLGIPLIDNALLEDDDDLRELWCKLIANSLDPSRNFELKYVYIDIIKSLTPLDAKVLKYINEYMNKELPNKEGVISLKDIHVGFKEIFKEFPNEDWFINVSLTNLMRVRCIQDVFCIESLKDGIVNERNLIINQTFTLTSLGKDLISSCMED